MEPIERVNGPYFNKTTGRYFVCIRYEGGRRRTTTYARHVMEQHLGYVLPRSVDVDHIDNDKTNDALENLQVLGKRENIQKHWGPEGPPVKRAGMPSEIWTFPCPVCSTEVEMLARNVRRMRHRGSRGPFCSKSCAGKDAMARRWHGSPAPLPTLPA